jgi:hypothetical protein
VLAAGAVAEGTAIGGVLLGLAGAREAATSAGMDTWAGYAGDGSSGVMTGEGELVVLPDGAGCLVGDGLALGVADGVGEGLAVGVADGVGDGVLVGVADGVGDGVLVGVAVGVADDEGVADASDGEGLGVGVAVAGKMTATVEAVTTWPGTLAKAPAGFADKFAEEATPAPAEHAIAVAAPAVTVPRTVRMPLYALRG